jgi:apolipoprotein N-acyltransferase
LPDWAAVGNNEGIAMNWRMLAGGLMALSRAAGHAIAGRNIWHLITINFTLSALALFVLGALGRQDAAAWLISAHFRYWWVTIKLTIVLVLSGAVLLFAICFMPGFGARFFALVAVPYCLHLRRRAGEAQRWRSIKPFSRQSATPPRAIPGTHPPAGEP